MSTKEILEEINRLPVETRYRIVHQTLKSIHEAQKKNSLSNAVDTMQNDYVSDKELTAFSNLDCEDFYEPR